MYLSDACKIVQKYGDPLEEDCKGNDEIPVCTTIAQSVKNNPSIMAKAIQYKINSYYDCNTNNDIKYAIS